MSANYAEIQEFLQQCTDYQERLNLKEALAGQFHVVRQTEIPLRIEADHTK